MTKRDRVDHQEWTDRLSDYLEGDLGPDEHRSVEEHLGQCGSCRRVLEELRGVVTRAAALGPLDPPRDLWPGIEATISAPVPADDPVRVIAFPHQARGDVESETRPRRVAFTRGQLLAASVVLIAVSSLATWAAAPGVGGAGAVTPVAPTDGPFQMAADAGIEAPSTVVEEVAALEQTLAAARERLDPNTVRVLERNLAIIQRAIDDSKRALALDPGNEFLTEHLERAYERKLDLLREAAQVVEWAG